MTKLTDTQAILLSTASQREDGSVLPLPASITPGGGASKAVAALLKRGLAEERETRNTTAVDRTDGDIGYGVFLTAAGAEAIGVELPELAVGDDAGVAASAPSATAASATASPKPPSKTAAVLALLSRPDGATLPELIEATGWLPHTTRAALTGIRKKGHDVARTKRDGATCYRIAGQG
jgi:hypothetical protein